MAVAKVISIQASELISILKEKYGKCSYYSDRGVIQTFAAVANEESYFETEFKNRDSFIFKKYSTPGCEEEDKTVVTVSNGKGKIRFSKYYKERKYAEEIKNSNAFPIKQILKYSKRLNDQMLEYESKTLPVEIIPGLSGLIETSLVTYDLFFPDSKNNWTFRNNVTLLSDSYQNGKLYYHLWCRDKNLEIWVDKENHFIEKTKTTSGSYLENQVMSGFSNFVAAYLSTTRLKREEDRQKSKEFIDKVKRHAEDPSTYRVCKFTETKII